MCRNSLSLSLSLSLGSILVPSSNGGGGGGGAAVEEENGVRGRREIYLHFCTVNPAVIAAYIRGRFVEPIAEFDFSRARACGE